PLYPQKLSRLYTEFVETGEADRLGYGNPAELRERYPEFFYEQVYPYLSEGLRFLRKTQEGQQWIANLFHHVHEIEDTTNLDRSSEVGPLPHAIPHIAVNNR
ncbi:MAG: hypothetical protein ACC642_09615, partial [Pseudomonadales bacterium]